MFVYLILSGVIGFFAQVAFTQVFSFNTQLLAGIIIQLLVYIPLPALFVRRLHDQDRSGLFAIVILPIIAFNLYKSIAFASDGMTEQLFHPFNPIRLFTIPFALAAIVWALWPGSSGENRYGPDPREVE